LFAKPASTVAETKCITGKVLHVKAGAKGVHFIGFGEEQAGVSVLGVGFASDLKDVGDVRRLEGRVIEIRGPVKLYDGRAETILNRVSQLTGGSTLIPPSPRTTTWKNRATIAPAACVPLTKKPAKVKGTPNPSPIYGSEADVENELPK
jgi:hypothetical protein